MNENQMTPTQASDAEQMLDNIAKLVKSLHDSPKSLHFHMTEWADRYLVEKQNVSQPAPASPWMPIESAPKYRRVVMLYDPSFGAVNANIKIGYWHEGYREWCDREARTLHPTHWQPLPAPPREEGK